MQQDSQASVHRVSANLCLPDLDDIRIISSSSYMEEVSGRNRRNSASCSGRGRRGVLSPASTNPRRARQPFCSASAATKAGIGAYCAAHRFTAGWGAALKKSVMTTVACSTGSQQTRRQGDPASALPKPRARAGAFEFLDHYLDLRWTPVPVAHSRHRIAPHRSPDQLLFGQVTAWPFHL